MIVLQLRIVLPPHAVRPVLWADRIETIQAYIEQSRVPPYAGPFDPGSQLWNPTVTRYFRAGTLLEDYQLPIEGESFVDLGHLSDYMRIAAEQAKASWMALRAMPGLHPNEVRPLAIWETTTEPAILVDAKSFTYPRPRDGWPDEDGQPFHFVVDADVSTAPPRGDDGDLPPNPPA